MTVISKIPELQISVRHVSLHALFRALAFSRAGTGLMGFLLQYDTTILILLFAPLNFSTTWLQCILENTSNPQ